MSILHNDWATVLNDEFQKRYYLELRAFLKEEYQTQTIYPSMYDIFNALHETSFIETKVVILGQDPYHGPNQAHGLSFSVKPNVPTPPSLQNIFKELRDDLGCEMPNNGHLTKWAAQGILLLNTVLTVRKGQAASHRGKGWEYFTDRIISCLNERKKPVIFVLWGRHAQEKQALITNERHDIITAPHPSPFSANRGFFGSRPFSTMNRMLQERGETSIDWQIPNL